MELRAGRLSRLLANWFAGMSLVSSSSIVPGTQ
jgi:hypothetical protein